MKVVISYSKKDYNLAFYAVEVMLRRTDVKPGDLVLYGSVHAPQPPKSLYKPGMMYLQCKGDTDTYPQGPNIMAAALFSMIFHGSIPGDTFMLTEPDAFPTCDDWYHKVLNAHQQANTWVTGSIVNWVDPVHINGNLVIEKTLIDRYPCLTRPVMEAWDCHHAELLIERGKKNSEIHNPRRDLIYYPTEWWKQYKHAWVHGCQNFQMWELIDKEGFGWTNEG